MLHMFAPGRQIHGVLEVVGFEIFAYREIYKFNYSHITKFVTDVIFAYHEESSLSYVDFTYIFAYHEFSIPCNVLILRKSNTLKFLQIYKDNS